MPAFAAGFHVETPGFAPNRCRPFPRDRLKDYGQSYAVTPDWHGKNSFRGLPGASVSVARNSRLKIRSALGKIAGSDAFDLSRFAGCGMPVTQTGFSRFWGLVLRQRLTPAIMRAVVDQRQPSTLRLKAVYFPGSLHSRAPPWRILCSSVHFQTGLPPVEWRG